MVDATEKTGPDPLEMARNCLHVVQEAAEMQASDDPDTRLLAHVRQVGQQGRDAAGLAGQLALVSIAADLRRLADGQAPVPALSMPGEHIGREGDWLHCLCGNTPDMDGFAPCLADGAEVEPLAAGPWGGKLYACNRCGRIVDQDTLKVTGRRAAGAGPEEDQP